MKIGAVILAAGASTRLGEPKQLLRDHNDETLVHKVAREALAAGALPVVVVLGADANDVGRAVSDLAVNTVVNTHWPEGLGSSIRTGVRTLAQLDVALVHANARTADGDPHAAESNPEASTVDAVLLLTCDMPSVGIPHLSAMLQAAAEQGARVASGYDYTRGIPAIIPRDEFVLLELLTGDRGAKALLMQPDTVVVRLVNGAFDLDTPENVAAWRAAGAP